MFQSSERHRRLADQPHLSGTTHLLASTQRKQRYGINQQNYRNNYNYIQDNNVIINQLTSAITTGFYFFNYIIRTHQ